MKSRRITFSLVNHRWARRLALLLTGLVLVGLATLALAGVSARKHGGYEPSSPREWFTKATSRPLLQRHAARSANPGESASKATDNESAAAFAVLAVKKGDEAGAGSLAGDSLTNPTTSLVSSINRASGPLACATSSVDWTVTFTTPVSGVTASNFSLVNGAGASITNVTGSGTTWTVTANVGTAAVALVLIMVNSDGISPSVTNLPYTGQPYTINVRPAITLGASPTVGQGTTTSSLPYTTTAGSPNQYSIDYDSTANAAGFVDVTNASFPASPILLTVPGGAATGTYNATLTLLNSAAGCVSNSVAFTVRLITCPGMLTVNDVGDAADASPGDGVCATSGNVCTLRAAIEEANAITFCSPLTINITATGTITLGSALPALAHPNLTITGPGANVLTISGNNANRVFNITSGNVTLENLTIANGRVTTGTTQGGGIHNSSSGTVNIRNCALVNNAVVASSAQGGGILMAGGTLNISDSILSGNAATASGGTSASGLGGGMYFSTGTVNLTNTTFANNTCAGSGATGSNWGIGGGVYSSGALTLTNCTFSGNSVSASGGSSPRAEGGGIYQNAGSVLLKNTIVAKNTALSGPDIRTFNSVTSQGNNLIGNKANATITNQMSSDLVGGGVNPVIEPLLASLGNYGGPTQTFALLPGSPAINAGTASGAPPNDQRGITRFGNVDIGAFESRGFTLALSSGSPQSANITTAFASPLSVTVSSSNGEPVNGGKVTFTPPVSGASATLTTTLATIASGAATAGTATANTVAGGPYAVVASAAGAANVNFNLTNDAVTQTNITLASANPVCANSPVSWIVAFSQAVTGLTASNFSLLGGTGATITNVTGSGTAWTVTANTGTAAAAALVLKMVNSTGVTPPVTGLPIIGQVYTVTAANAGPDQAFCSTSPATLAANTPLVGTGEWMVVSGPSTAAAQFSSTISPTATFTPAGGTGVYTLRWTISNGPCATLTDDVVLTYNALPTITVGASPSVPFGSTSANLPYSATTGSPDQYSIDFDTTANTAGFVDLLNLTLFSSPMGMTVPSAVPPGVYNATLTVRNSTTGCASAPVAFTVTITACPTSFTVNSISDGSDARPGNGICETATGNGICTLRAAIQEANLLSGCSLLTINFDTAGVFATPQTITLTGGGLTILRSLTIAGPGADRVTLSGNGFSSPQSGFTINYSGLTISGGSTGISNSGSLVTVTDCVVSGISGTGVNNSGGTMTVTNCVIKNNTGGGLANFGTKLTVTNCQIMNNSGSQAIYSSGSGLFELSDCTIANNQGTGLSNSVTATVTNCLFTGNTSTNEAGGIKSSGTLTLSNSTLENNTGVSAGGLSVNGTLNMTGCTLANNTATGEYNVAGGMFTLSAQVSLSNSTFSGNRANNAIEFAAGGLQMRAGFNLANCTFTNNEATGNGNAGGVLRLAGAMIMTNTIIAGNTGTNGATPDIAGTFISGGNNLIGDGTGGSGFNAAGDLVGTAANVLNPLLSVLGNYGGPTKTHALLPGSPALNAGTETGVPTTDQRGKARFGSAPDLGAFESQGFTLVLNGGAPQATLINTTFASPLSAAVTPNNSTDNEPVNDGWVMFTPPVSGASASVAGTPAMIVNGAATTGTIMANGSPGSYSVTASTSGATPVNFLLTNACPAITVSPATLAGSATTGVAFSQTFTQAGGLEAITWNLLGSAPPGLSFNAATATLSGQPTQSGSFNFTIRATGANGCFGERLYTLVVNCALVTVGPQLSSLPGGTVGSPYAQTFTAAGGSAPYSFTTSGGALPPGLTLAANGALTGSPNGFGIFNFTVKGTDANGCFGERAYTLRICAILALTPGTLPAAVIGAPYSQTLTASGGTAPYSLAVTGGTLPPGLSLNTSGALTGTPTQTGSSNFTVTATDANGCSGTQSYALSVDCPAITVTPTTLPLGIAGVPYSQSLTQTGGNGAISWSVSAGALPAGLSLNGTTGQLAGLSLLAGTFNFTIRATDVNNCSGERAYSLTFRPKAKADFDNDGKTDLSVFRPTAVDPVPNWLALGSLNSAPVNFSWGGGYAPYFDVPVPGDYDGDGKADYAIWRGADTFWYLRRSSDGQPVLVFYGANFAPYFDIPTPGDFDGDGKTDIAVFRRSGTWFIRRSSDGGDTLINHGQAGDVPLAADFDGDGKCDLGLFRPDAVAPMPNWLILQSSTNTVVSLQWGGGYAPYFDVPVPADYDGDGKADLAIWRGADSIWYIRPSASPNNPILDLWGANYAPYNDIPTPGDYDGDGKADIAVFRRSGTWFVKRSSNGSFLIQEQGQQGDVPLPANGVR